MGYHPSIHRIRGRHVMLASNLAPLFGVTPKLLNQQIRRNERRFPTDFGFRLTRSETDDLMPHFEASSSGHGGHRHPPFVVTEYGVVMLANVLNSARAIDMSVKVVREFIRLRAIARSGCALKEKLRRLELAVKSRLDEHGSQIDELFDAVQRLIAGPDDLAPQKRIGCAP